MKNGQCSYPCPETLDWLAGHWSHGGRAWTFSGYGHVNSSVPLPCAHIIMEHLDDNKYACWNVWNISTLPAEETFLCLLLW